MAAGGVGAPAAAAAPATATDPANEPPEQTAARQLFRLGLETPAGYKPPPRAQVLATQMLGQANRILQTCQGGATGNCLAQLSALDPMTGATLTNVLNSKEGIPETLGQGGARGPSAYGELIRQFAMKVNPNWSSSNFKQLQEYKPGGKVYGQIQAANRLAEAGAQVLDAARKIGISTLPPANVIREWMAGNVTGTGDWARLYSAFRIYTTMVSQLALGGVARTTYINQMMNHVRIEGPKAVLAGMQVDANDAVGALSSLVSTYHQLAPGRSLPPGLEPDNVEILNALTTSLNTNTGTFPGLKKIPRRLTPGHAGQTLDVTPSPAAGTDGGGDSGGWSITPVQ
jgi:hypothetical protein